MEQLKLVNFEQAKLLKEKEFNIPVKQCYAVYIEEINDGSRFVPVEQHIFQDRSSLPAYDYNFSWSDNTEEEYLLSAPTQALVCKWLRDVHGIVINCPRLRRDTTKGVVYSYDGSIKKIPQELRKGGFDTDWFPRITLYNTYEEAESAAIEYTLKNLI